MDDRELIRRTLCLLTRRLRFVRAVTAGVRFMVVGLAAALIPLIVKGIFPLGGPLAAAALAGGLAILGFLYGLLAGLPASHVARLADAGLQFKERLTSARELLAVSELEGLDTGDVIRAQLAETASRLREIHWERAFPMRLPPEAQWIAPVAVLVTLLTLLPPIPLHMPAAGADSMREKLAAREDAAREKPLEQKLTPAGTDQRFARPKERQVQRGQFSAREQLGDLNAVFQDTKMSQQRPDFSGFIKQGDERLKLLARPESIPDLNRDFTRSPYQVAIRRMQEQARAGRLQGLTWEQIERLLTEKGQSGRRFGDGDPSDDLMNELQQGDGEATDKSMDALSRAFNRLRDRDEAARSKGRSLREARDVPLGSGTNRGEGAQGKDEGGENSGRSMLGRGKSLETRGDPTARIEGEKQDSYLEGDLRGGRTEGLETDLSGPGAQNSSRLTYLDVFSRYRKMMEEALTKEPIPFNYREQVKDYFRSLESW